VTTGRYWGSYVEVRGRVTRQPVASLTSRGSVFTVLPLLEHADRPADGIKRMYFPVLIWTESLARQVISSARPGQWCEVSGHLQTRPREGDIPELAVIGEKVKLWQGKKEGWLTLLKVPQAPVVPTVEALLA
jgi:single-stranded DNA-binding protein